MAVIRFALPTGNLRCPTAAFLESVGVEIIGYGSGSRAYRLSAEGRADLEVRVFREQDIPIQIALGNYDLGICDLASVEELVQHYPNESIVKISKLDFGRSYLFAAVAAYRRRRWTDDRRLRIVSEYPYLAEAFAMSARLGYHRVMPVWGAAEVYPPEDADIAVVTAGNEQELRSRGLEPIATLLESSACLVANRESLTSKPLGDLLASLAIFEGGKPEDLRLPKPGDIGLLQITRMAQRPSLRLALPDGHQQPHAVAVLEAAGLSIKGYTDGKSLPRPLATIPDVDVKVIRPQDMPQQVALGNFDLAVTGRDWLLDHLRRFPDSPVEEVADLGYGCYTIAAVVSQELIANTLEEALTAWRREGRQTIRIASEYTSLADDYARSRHFGRYQVIPITGASEGFVPEDADILIEGTETGKTIAENNLRIIDVLFSSTTCLIARKGRLEMEPDSLVAKLATQLSAGALSQAGAPR